MEHTKGRKQVLRIGVGGPVGSGKTALVDKLCKSMRDEHRIAVVTNDIYTKEDQQFLIRSQALVADRIVWRGDRRMPAYRDPRGRLDQPCGRR